MKFRKIEEDNMKLTETNISESESIDDAKLIFQKLPDTLKKFLAKGLKSYTIYN